MSAQTLRVQVLGNPSTFNVTVNRAGVPLGKIVDRVALRAGLTGPYQARSQKRGITLDPEMDPGHLPEDDQDVVLLPEELTPAT